MDTQTQNTKPDLEQQQQPKVSKLVKGNKKDTAPLPCTRIFGP